MPRNDDVDFERFMANGDKLRDLKWKLQLTKLDKPIVITSHIEDRIIYPLVLTPAELRQLKAEIWQTQMDIYQYALRDTTARFGKPDQWIIEAIEKHRAQLIGVA